MEPLDTFNRWAERAVDRERAVAFLRFLWRRFQDDRLFEAAGALAFTTVFALVPLSMVVFGVLSAFPVFEAWSEQLTDYVFSNFVPDSARRVEDYLLAFSQNIGQLTTLGVIALVVSVLVTLQGVEATFNRIWRVATARPKVGRFLVYWTVLTLGALVAAASLALFTRFLALDIFHATSSGQWLQRVLLQATPLLIELVAIATVYRVIPHRTVQWRHAFAGALLAALLLELAKRLIAFYLGSFDGYQRIYGQVAFIPVLLLWIYFCWLAILLGASFAASLSAFRYQPLAMRLPPGFELYGLLRLLGRFGEARREGRCLHTGELLAMEPSLSDALLQRLFAQLEPTGLLVRAEDGGWVLARDLDTVALGELYEACRLRIPDRDESLPCDDDAIGRAARAALDELRAPLHALLRRPVGDIHPHAREPEA